MSQTIGNAGADVPIETIRPKYSPLLCDYLIGVRVCHREPKLVDIICDRFLTSATGLANMSGAYIIVELTNRSSLTTYS